MTHVGVVAAIERLRAGRATPLKIEGVSMEPLFRRGEKVLLEPCDPRALRRGDLVAFERGDRLVLHRVLAVRGATGDLVEKGDNAPRSARVEARRVLGRAVATLEPRAIDLRRGRVRALGPWIARLSALHGLVHRLDRTAARYPSTGLRVVLRLFDRLLHAVRRLQRGKQRSCPQRAESAE